MPDDINNGQHVNGVKNGRYELGSGTSPAILGEGKYVAITANAKQMKVVVSRTAERLRPNEERLVCKVAVFGFGRGGVQDSFAGLGRSMVLVNNDGAKLDPQRFLSAPSDPGGARVDIAPSGKSCEVAWTNTTVTPASYGAKLSTRTGLVYLFARTPDPISRKDVWFWNAIDFRTPADNTQRILSSTNTRGA